MNKRKFLKLITLSFSSVFFLKNFISKPNLSNKLIVKREHSKVWFFHINDF